MIHAYVVLPTGEWLHLEENEMHFDIIKRYGFLNDFEENEPNAYDFFKELGYTDDDEINDEDENTFDDIEFKYKQNAVKHALKKGVLRIRYYKEGDITRGEKIILFNGDINRITSKIIETAFKKFNVLNTTTLIIEDCEFNEVFKGSYDNYKVNKLKEK